MQLASTFLGISLAFAGAAVGCVVLAATTRDEFLQFYAIWGGVVCFALALGTAVASGMAFREII